MGSHRRLESPGVDRGANAALCVMSAAAAAIGVVPATAAPHDDTRAKVDRLYEEAEKATEAYNKADERADKLREQVHDAQDRIARQQEDINSMRDALGSLAGAQYRSGGLDPSLALLLSEDPEDDLDRAARSALPMSLASTSFLISTMPTTGSTSISAAVHMNSQNSGRPPSGWSGT